MFLSPLIVAVGVPASELLVTVAVKNSISNVPVDVFVFIQLFSIYFT